MAKDPEVKLVPLADFIGEQMSRIPSEQLLEILGMKDLTYHDLTDKETLVRLVDGVFTGVVKVAPPPFEPEDHSGGITDAGPDYSSQEDEPDPEQDDDDDDDDEYEEDQEPEPKLDEILDSK